MKSALLGDNADHKAPDKVGESCGQSVLCRGDPAMEQYGRPATPESDGL